MEWLPPLKTGPKVTMKGIDLCCICVLEPERRYFEHLAKYPPRGMARAENAALHGSVFSPGA